LAKKSNRRFYLARYEFNPERIPVFEDLGTELTIAGMVFQGVGSTLVLLSPGVEWDPNFEVAKPDIDEWGEIIRQTDDPEIFVSENGGITKVLHRKLRYSLSGDVQQKIWARDGFQCVFCGARMGTTLMTVDHFIPLELGGANDDSNYITACRRCNKGKGTLLPEKFCQVRGFEYQKIKEYLDNCKRLT